MNPTSDDTAISHSLAIPLMKLMYNCDIMTYEDHFWRRTGEQARRSVSGVCIQLAEKRDNGISSCPTAAEGVNPNRVGTVDRSLLVRLEVAHGLLMQIDHTENGDAVRRTVLSGEGAGTGDHQWRDCNEEAHEWWET